ncbi:uncharacterized protein LOC141726573 isoform X9 [Zonotrichia albicollis]|uniref:uncharacterized protein LOC141726573 isoform X9 n=1 Tax=Zonotrichia albicollis TaxID=44394 RepID=UPI003D80E834
MLGGALLDLVFNDEPETEPEDQEAAESRLEALQGRRSLLAAFCRLLLRGVLELSAAADVFKQYCRFFRDFGDIIRELLRLTRDLDRDAWARTVLLSLQQLFTELLLQEGPALPALPPFRRLRELGRALARLCGLGGTGNRNRNRNRNRAALLALHSPVRLRLRLQLQPVALQPRPHLHGAQEAPPPDQTTPLPPSAQQRLQEDLGVPPDPDGGGGRGGGRGGGGRRGDPKQPREPPGAAPGPFWLLQPRLPDFLKPQFQISLGVFSQFLEFSTQNF